MKKNCAYDVVIAGGALTGLSMAALLADTNVNVALVAPSAPPVRDRRTTAVAAGPQTLLNACGVWKKINHAEPIRHIRVLDIGRPQPLNFYAHHHAPFGWIIDNADLLGALKERVREAKNISMIDDVVTRVEADAHFSSIATQRHGTLKAKVLAAADGRQSKLRQQAGIAAHQQLYKQTAIVAMLSHTHPHHQMALEYFMPTGPLAVLPFVSEKNKHHSALVWSTTPDAAADLMIMTEQTFCAWLKKYVGEWLGDITLASARQAWPLNELKAEKSFKARLVLLGEAAHAMHPIAGQGYNLTMRNLGALKKIWRDIKHTGGDVGAHCALAGYHRARQFDTWRMMTAMDGLVKGFSNNLPGFSLLRQLGLSVVDLSPSLKEKFANQAMGTEISASSRKSIKIV